MTRPIYTQDIDVAAAVMTATGHQPEICFRDGDKLATFELPGDELTINLLARYSTGDLTINVKRFAACRNALFRKLKGVR